MRRWTGICLEKVREARAWMRMGSVLCFRSKKELPMQMGCMASKDGFSTLKPQSAEGLEGCGEVVKWVMEISATFERCLQIPARTGRKGDA